jgi:hypothetical protein
MEFGNTYIFLFGFKFFEPMVVLTNLIIFLVSIYCFRKLIVFENKYAKKNALFILLMGISTCFASIDHTVQYQLGIPFFKFILFISHSLNIIGLYFCFLSAYTFHIKSHTVNNIIKQVAILITLILIIISLLTGSFLTIKIPAALVLVYSLTIYYLGYKEKIKGSGIFAIGIIISFFSIIVHTLKLSFNDWFNHKDIAHIIIAISLIIMCKAVSSYSQNQIEELSFN